ncbi:MAG TPA: biotin/lipoyl-binding protein [Aliiroseovarius sp.]|nr:biotin/lipoyl-binding protein [Aliiroseovarius sp.]
MGLTHRDVRRILELLEQAKHLDHVEITLGEYVLRAGKSPLRNASASAVPAAPAAHAVAAPIPAEAPAREAPPTEIPEGAQAVRAPMAGTFYLKPGPEEADFVSDGALVAEGDTLCLVEVMKMFNSIAAPCAGRVLSIVAEHGAPVQTGDILMILAPEAGQ